MNTQKGAYSYVQDMPQDLCFILCTEQSVTTERHTFWALLKVNRLDDNTSCISCCLFQEQRQHLQNLRLTAFPNEVEEGGHMTSERRRSLCAKEFRKLGFTVSYFCAEPLTPYFNPLYSSCPRVMKSAPLYHLFSSYKPPNMTHFLLILQNMFISHLSSADQPKSLRVFVEAWTFLLYIV